MRGFLLFVFGIRRKCKGPPEAGRCKAFTAEGWSRCGGHVHDVTFSLDFKANKKSQAPLRARPRKSEGIVGESANEREPCGVLKQR